MTTPIVFLTGATGFLGRHLVPALCRAGYATRALVRQPERHPWLAAYPSLEVVQGDLSNPDTLSAAMTHADVVIHAAGLFRFWGRPDAFESINVLGTAHMLDAARRNSVSRFIYVSTIAVVGQPEPGRLIDEAHPLHPADAYQDSKARSERLVEAARQDGLPALIVRPGAFYGPLGTYAFNRLFFRDPMRGIVMQIDGGRHIIFPAYVPGIARAIVQSITRGQPGEVYNLCDEPISHRAAFDVVIREANLHVMRLNLPGWMGIASSRVMEALSTLTGREPFYPLNLKSYVYNDWRVTHEKAARELGFEPTPFTAGARETIRWYRDGQPDHIPAVDCE